MSPSMRSVPATFILVAAIAGCSSDDAPANGGSSSSGAASSSSGGSSGAPGTSSSSGSSSSSSGGGPATNPLTGPAAGNPDGKGAVPAAAQLEDVSKPRTVVGSGTPESCTGDAFVAAVAKGGVITFDCGPNPVTITLTATAKIVNNTGPKIVIDGGNKVTLSGGGKVRILYLNACDKAQVWISGNCNEQTDPQLVLQNLTFVDGNAKGLDKGDNEGGGGAVYAKGGQLKVLNSRFFNNVCDDLGSDVGGGAIRKLDYLADGVGNVNRRVYVVGSTFGGAAGYGNTCANGGAISSIGISWTIVNSVFSHNSAIGRGANDGEGGNGGAIYNDGRLMTLEVAGSILRDNKANEGGSAIFFVSNDETGSIKIVDSTIQNNPKGAFETSGFPGFFIKAKSPPEVIRSTIAR